MLNINLSFIRKYALGLFLSSVCLFCAMLAVISLIRCSCIWSWFAYGVFGLTLCYIISPVCVCRGIRLTMANVTKYKTSRDENSDFTNERQSLLLILLQHSIHNQDYYNWEIFVGRFFFFFTSLVGPIYFAKWWIFQFEIVTKAKIGWRIRWRRKK